MTVRVSDRGGQALAGATVSVGSRSFATNKDGIVSLAVPAEPRLLTVELAGYEPVFGAIDQDSARSQQVKLRSTTVAGIAKDKNSGAPIAGATVQWVSAKGSGPVLKTAADGRFRLTDVPEAATVRINAGDYGSAQVESRDGAPVEFAMTVSVVTGRVTDASGAPIAGAAVTAPGGDAVMTGQDGSFRLGGVTDAATLEVAAPGYASGTVAATAGKPANLALQRQDIKAVYANVSTITDPDRLGALIRLADETEINAIVLDVKQDTIDYDTQVPFFRSVEGMVVPAYDPVAVIATLKQHGIYVIARMVVFKDPLVAESRPDLAVKIEGSNELWRDMNGAAWVNAFDEELWHANADLAVELSQLGFDEVQYDYIRFPSDGDLTTTDFGRDYTELNRRAAITGAVKAGHDALQGTGTRFAIDLFAIVALYGDDQGIGQTLQDLTPLADYVCLMVYPSHFSEGNIPVPGHPNDFPGETVTYTLQQAELLVPGSMIKMRPWLQDFTQPLDGFSPYGPKEVRAQIDSAEALGVGGWMLWNAAGEFEEDALVHE